MTEPPAVEWEQCALFDAQDFTDDLEQEVVRSSCCSAWRRRPDVIRLKLPFTRG